MTDDLLDAKRKKLEKLDTDNGEVFDELTKNIRGFTANFGEVRMNMLVDALKGTDLLPEEFWLDFEIKYHETVKEAMAEPLAQLQAARRRAGLTIPRQDRPRLLDGKGRPIGG